MKRDARNEGPRRRERAPLFRPSVREEVDSELSFHIEMRTRELIARGMSPEAARADAVKRFGSIERVSDICRDIGNKRERDMRRTAYWAELLHDVRYALRQLRGAPGFTAVAVLTLGLGIGATTAIFSLVQAVVLKPFPWEHPDRVMQVAERWQDQDSNVSAGNYVDWKAASTSFDAMAAADWVNLNLVEGDAPERVLGAMISHDFFDVFGARPALGRTFLAEEDQPGRDDVVILSHELWTSRFLGDRGILDREIRLGDRRYRVVGVMPEGFDPIAQAERLWVPLAFTPERRQMHDEHYLFVVGLLKSGVSVERAQAEMDGIAQELERRFPEANSTRGIRVSSLSDAIVGNLRSRLFTLLAAVTLVLLIACSNLANLLLARGAARGKEIAIRASLGAGRGRVVRQLLTESLVLALVTAVAGTVLARYAVRVLVATSPQGVPRVEQAGIDAVVLLFALGLAFVSSIVFGLAPALRASKHDIQGVLREGGRGSALRVRDRLRGGLIAGEVALSLTLLVGAGLLIRSAILLSRVDPGFDPRGVITARVTLPPAAYGDTEHMRLAFERMAATLSRSPGVTSAAITSQVPMGIGGGSNGLIPDGKPLSPEHAIDSRLRMVTPALFETLSIPLRRGRVFDATDGPAGDRVMVISESLAQRAFPDEDPIGKRIHCCEEAHRSKTVIGVVGDVRSQGPGQDFYPEFYLPVAQAPAEAFNWVQGTMTLVARGQPGDEETLVNAMRRAVREIDPTVPLHTVATMHELIGRRTAAARFNTMLLGALGAIGLILAAVGIASVIAYFVSLRTQEIGVRMALGASRGNVVRLVARQALAPVLLGVVAGVGLSLVATRLLESSLFGVAATDAVTFATVVAVFLAAAGLAAYVPARRATRVHPAQALHAG